MVKAAFWALVAFIFSVPMQESLTEVLYGYTGSIPRLVGIAAFVVGVAALMYDARLRHFNRNHVLIFFFFAWAGLSVVWTQTNSAGLTRAISYAQMGAMVWLLLQYAPDRHRQTTLMAAYVLGSYVTVALLLKTYAGGTANSLTQWGERYVAFSTDPNEQALMLALGIPMAWHCVVHRRGLVQLLTLIYIPAAFLGITLTGSRGGFLSAAAALLVVPLNYVKVPNYAKVLAIAAFTAGGIAISVLLPEATFERLMTLKEMVLDQSKYAEASLEDTNMRILIWQEGLETFMDHPTVGVGAGAYPEAVDRVRGGRYVAHSVWVSVLVELGVVGFFILLGIIGVSLLTVRRMPKTERRTWYVLLLTWAVGVTFLTWEHRKPTWLLFGMIAAQGSYMKALAQQARVKRPWSYTAGSAAAAGPPPAKSPTPVYSGT